MIDGNWTKSCANINPLDHFVFSIKYIHDDKNGSQGILSALIFYF